MDFIPLLRAKKNALDDCKGSLELPPEKRTQMQHHLQMIQYTSWGTKGAILLGILVGVDWKRKVSVTRREVPLALGAIALCAVSDYLVLEHVWGQHEKEVSKLTGFKNGIYVKPEVMARMRKSMAAKQLRIED